MAILEVLDLVRSELIAATQNKQDAEQELSRLEQELASNLNELEAKRSELVATRQKLVATLDPELSTAYQRKADRGSSAGKLIGRECGACRLSITATNLDEIIALPSDEIAECPNCQAYLVRS